MVARGWLRSKDMLCDADIISKKISDKIRGLSFLAAVLVVPLHCTSFSEEWFNVVESVGATAKILTAGKLLFCQTISLCAVPWFLIISGFFLMKHCEPTLGWYSNLLRKKIKTLLLPYLIWNVIQYFLKLINGSISFRGRGVIETLSFIVGWPLGSALPCGQFWYVRCLLVYAVAAPIFYVLLKNLFIGLSLILGMTIFWLSGYSGLGYQVLDLQILYMFSLGVFLYFHHGAVIKCLEKTCKYFKVFVPLCLVALIGVRVIAGAFGVKAFYDASRKYLIITGIMTAWFSYEGFIGIVLEKVKRYWGHSFFLFAIHTVYISLFLRLTRFAMKVDHDLYFIVFVLSVCCSVMTGVLIKRYTPAVYQLLTGGRNSQPTRK